MQLLGRIYVFCSYEPLSKSLTIAIIIIFDSFVNEKPPNKEKGARAIIYTPERDSFSHFDINLSIETG